MKTDKFLKFIKEQGEKNRDSIVNEGKPLDYSFDNIQGDDYRKALESSINLANPFTASLPDFGVLGIMKAAIGASSALSGSLAGYSKLFPKRSENTTDYYDYIPKPDSERYASAGGYFSNYPDPPKSIKYKEPARPEVNTIPKYLDPNYLNHLYYEEKTNMNIIPKDLNLAMNSIIGLGMVDDVLSYNEFKSRYDDDMRRRGNTDYLNPSNIKNPYGDYTPNKGLGSNFQLSNSPIIRQAKCGGKIYEQGGVYNISKKELEALRKEGIDFDILD